MKKLLPIVVAGLLGTQAHAQINCNAAISASANQNVATLTNSSTPTSSQTLSVGYNINWGDGSNPTYTWSNANQVHTYANIGQYTIRLIQNAIDSSKNPVQSCVDTAYAVVNITSAPGKIEGTIWVDSTSNLDSYKVWLIQYNSTTNILSAVDSQIIVTMAGDGNYSFANPAAGSYRVKAARYNGPTSGTGHVPTYHTNASLWSNATVINYSGTGTTSGKDIHMLTGTLTPGPGFVGGNVSQGANKGTANGIEGMNILLMDANNNPVAYAITDVNGDYKFQNIGLGTYKVHPENMNYTTTAATVTVTAVNTSVTAINFERSNSQKSIVPITSGITNVNSSELAFGLYPNPAKNSVTLAWDKLSDDKANVTITDISGKKVAAMEVKMNANAIIEIGNLQNGFYFLNVATESGSNTQKLLVQ